MTEQALCPKCGSGHPFLEDADGKLVTLAGLKILLCPLMEREPFILAPPQYVRAGWADPMGDMREWIGRFGAGVTPHSEPTEGRS